MGNLFFDEPGVKHVPPTGWKIGDVACYIGPVVEFRGMTFRVRRADSPILRGTVMPGNTCPAVRAYREGSEIAICASDCELVGRSE